MELKEIDHKIISYLFHHADEPISKIAKALKLSRDQVSYRIDKYLEEGIILKFMTLFDYSQFGYNCFASLFFKFEKNSSVEKFIKKLEKHKNIISYGKCLGKYDLWLNAIFKDDKELSDFVSEIISNSEFPLHEYFIMKPYFAELYPLKSIKHSPENFPVVEESSKAKRKFDSKEIEILKMLEKNSRESIVNIASKINSSAELTLYKIRKLKQNKVIVGTRLLFDFKKLGYSATGLFLNLPNLSKNNKEKLIQFARTSKHTSTFSLFFSRPNCFIQIFHKNEKELRDTIKELKETFNNETLEIEILPIEEDESLNTLPFL